MAVETQRFAEEDSDSPLSSLAPSILGSDDGDAQTTTPDKPKSEKASSQPDHISSGTAKWQGDNFEKEANEYRLSRERMKDSIRAEERIVVAEVSADVDMAGSQDSITVGGEDAEQLKPRTRTSAGNSAARRRISSGTKKGPSAQAKAAATRKARAEARKWEAPFVLTDEKSPLGDANLRDILLLPRAWDVLAPGERQLILSMLPDATNILNAGTEDARPDLASLRNDNNFRHDCSQYTDNIKNGKHDEQWLREAWIAHEKRKRGEYDEFDVQKFERDWGVELPPEHRPKRRRGLDEAIDKASATVSPIPQSNDSPPTGSPDELGCDAPVVPESLTAVTGATSPAAVSEPHSHRSGSSKVGRGFAKVRIASGEVDDLNNEFHSVDNATADSQDPNPRKQTNEVKEELRGCQTPSLPEEMAKDASKEPEDMDGVATRDGKAGMPQAITA